jgi:hypothetical protein
MAFAPVDDRTRVQSDAANWVLNPHQQGTDDMRLSGKVALISGAAGGMGESEALIFARQDAAVVVGDILELEGRKVVTSSL